MKNNDRSTSFLKNPTDLLLCMLASVMLILSSPGVNLWPCAFIAWAFLAWGYDRGRVPFYKICFFTAFMWSAVSLSWIYVPLVVYGEAPGFAGVLMVLLTALAVALLFWFPYGYVVYKFNSHFLGALVFTALEFFKSKVFFGGLPWLNMAQTQHNNLVALQTVSVVGEQGLSALIMLTGIYAYYTVKTKGKQMVPLRTLSVLLAFTFIIGGFLYTTRIREGETFRARLVQTGLKQDIKWERETIDLVVADLVNKVEKAIEIPGDYDILILPESTFPVYPFYYPSVVTVLYEASAKPLIFGYQRWETDTDRHGIETYRFYNSVGFMDRNNFMRYDKTKLAPFGEYFPLDEYLRPIRVFFMGDTDLFTAGKEQTVFDAGKLKIAPMICYEGVFTDIWRKRVEMGANVVVLISNDSWFAGSWGKQQHMAIEKLRSVEYGRYLIRVTQDGISGVVDPYGNTVLLNDGIYEVKDIDFQIRSNKTPFFTTSYLWYVIALIIYWRIYSAKKRMVN